MTLSKEYNWYLIAKSKEEIDFGKYDIIQMNVSEKIICIAKFNNELYAYQSLCPHAGAKMVMGYIDAQGNAVCPLHRFKFSLKNGYNVTGEGYNMRVYPIKINEEGVYVGFKS
jgi:3-phenylpropionate/trans-cinnamate dioxygenase ferredoxin subunit